MMVHFQNAQSLQLATAKLSTVKGAAGTGKSVVSCCQIAVVVDGLSCGLVGKVVARLAENRKRLLGR